MSLIYSDLISVILKFVDSKFAIRVCMLVSREWFEQVLKIPIHLTFPNGLQSLKFKNYWALRIHSIMARDVTCLELEHLFSQIHHPQYFKKLDLSSCVLKEDAQKIISKSDRCCNLTELILDDANVGFSVKCLVSSLSNLQRLSLVNVPLWFKTFQCIADSPNMRNLTELSICGEEGLIDGKEALFLDSILNSENLKQLKKLDIGKNFFADVCYKVSNSSIAENLTRLTVIGIKSKDFPNLTNGSFQKLTELKITGSSLNNSLVDSLSNCPHMGGITSLNLSHCSLGRESLKNLSKSKIVKNLTYLDFSENFLRDGCAPSWASPVFSKLKTLRLRLCLIGDESCQFIGEIGSLTNLDISANYIKTSSVMHLNKLSKLKSLDVSHNPSLLDDGISIICGSESMANLTELKLSNTSLTPRGCKTFMDSPFFNLEVLEIDYNIGVGYWGVWFLSQSKCLSSITRLSMKSNFIGDAGCSLIANSQFLTRLEYLDLFNNGVSNVGLFYLSKSVNIKHLTHLILMKGYGRNGSLEREIFTKYFASSPYANNLTCIY